MSDENEWQPVRIAPIESIPAPCLEGLDSEAYAKDVGKIIYVRLDPEGSTCESGGRFFEIRSEDSHQLHGKGSPHACEHQILAD